MGKILPDINMTIKYFKELHKIIAQELNIKQINRTVAKTDKGDLCICYNEPDDRILLILDGKEIDKPKLLEKTLENLNFDNF